ncbi:MAG: NUDIX hydrolase [Gammaproteobacteria bacterium]
MAVRLIVPDSDGRVLALQRRAGEIAPRRWCLPGGGIESGETAEHAAIRELNEETGLVCNKPRFLFYQDSPPREPGQRHYINLYFECRCSGKIVLSEESNRAAWVASSELARYPMAFRNDDGLLRYWRAGDGRTPDEPSAIDGGSASVQQEETQ